MSEANLSPTQYLTFLLKGEVFAVDIRMVREIIPSGHMTKVPMMPPFIRGIINLRGAVVPVIDIQSRFGWERSVVNTKTSTVEKRHQAWPTGQSSSDQIIPSLIPKE